MNNTPIILSNFLLIFVRSTCSNRKIAKDVLQILGFKPTRLVAINRSAFLNGIYYRIFFSFLKWRKSQKQKTFAWPFLFYKKTNRSKIEEPKIEQAKTCLEDLSEEFFEFVYAKKPDQSPEFFLFEKLFWSPVETEKFTWTKPIEPFDQNFVNEYLLQIEQFDLSTAIDISENVQEPIPKDAINKIVTRAKPQPSQDVQPSCSKRVENSPKKRKVAVDFLPPQTPISQLSPDILEMFPTAGTLNHVSMQRQIKYLAAFRRGQEERGEI